MIKELIVKEDPKSPISEIFRTLRTNIQFMNNKKKLQSLLITSTLPGEGKSWVSANLAVTFAQAGKKVILLDADMRKGRQYAIFGVSPRPGLSNYLSGFTEDGKEVDLADYVQETEIENLYVIPSGHIPPNPSELLVSENMINLVENLKEICDIVIVDGPPTQLVTDSLILARIVDSTVIVAASNQTKKDNLHRIIDNIQKVGGKIAGVVVNKVPVSAKKYEQSYYYGSTAMSITSKKSNRRNVTNTNNKETKNRNTERARQLVNQNRKKEIDKKEEKRENREQEMLEEQYNKIEQNENMDEPKILQEEPNKEIVQNENMDRPKILEEKNSNVITNEETDDKVLEKTNDILKQINEYLENEKKNLK